MNAICHFCASEAVTQQRGGVEYTHCNYADCPVAGVPHTPDSWAAMGEVRNKGDRIWDVLKGEVRFSAEQYAAIRQKAYDEGCQRVVDNQKPPRTPEQIVEQTNQLARRLYRLHDYEANEYFLFYEATHPHEVQAWEGACAAQELLTDTDVEDALIDMLEE